MKGQAELKVMIKTNKSYGKNSVDENDNSEIMLTGTWFPFDEYYPFKRFNEEILMEHETKVKVVSKTLFLLDMLKILILLTHFISCYRQNILKYWGVMMRTHLFGPA